LVAAALLALLVPSSAHAKGLPDRVTFSRPGMSNAVPLADWSAFDYWGHFVDSPEDPIQPSAPLDSDAYLFTWEYAPIGDLVMRYYPAAGNTASIVDIIFVGGLERWYACSAYGDAVMRDIVGAP
jgi:hypothetical protein